jgi:hypothetical protein
MKPLVAPEAIRQSDIATFDGCPLELRFSWESEQRGDASGLAARGTLFHRFAKAAILHMRAHGERSIPVEIAMELLTEIIAQRDVPDDEVVHLPLRELRWLRVLVTKWAHRHSFTIERVVDVERRLYAKLPVIGPGGRTYERTITGQPDVLLAGPEPNGATVLDWKTGWAPPARRVEPEPGEPPPEDRLSDMGYVQQIVYGWLTLKNYPAVESVTEREYYVMHDDDPVREATVWRYELERIEDVLAAVVAQIDAAVEAGPKSRRWFPIAGSHCAFCPRPHDCPIREEVRIPRNEREAQRLAHEWIVAQRVREERMPILKGWVDHHGPIEVRHSKGRRAVGWVKNKTGDGRRFVMHEPEDAPPSPFDPLLEEAAAKAGVLVDA